MNTTPTPSLPAVRGHTPDIAEKVMMEFNLSDESFDSLPRGMAKDIASLIDSRDALLAALELAYQEMFNNAVRQGSGQHGTAIQQVAQAIASASGKGGVQS